MDTPHDSLAEQPPYPLPGTITTTFAPGPTLSEVPLPPRRRYPPRAPRRILLPVLLFAATCLTTFWAGSGPSIQIMSHDFVNRLFPNLHGAADGVVLFGAGMTGSSTWRR